MPLSRFAVPARVPRRPLMAATIVLVLLAVIATSRAAASSQPCTYYASTSGSDGNAGTSTRPFRTVSFLLSSLSAGQTGCLAAGETFSGDLSISRGGQAGAPITITSADSSNPATIKGRIVTKPGGDWITLSNLELDGANANALPSPTIGSDHVTLSHDDITNENTAICVNVIANPTWGTAHYTLIDANRIHNCGKLPATNHDHGVYISGYYTTVTNNDIYNNADRGIQLRGSQGAIVEYNVVDGNGEGVIFGDLSTTSNEVAYNIVSNSKVRSNVESYWGGGTVGTGNVFHHNCTYATNSNSYYDSSGGVDTRGGGYAVQSLAVGNPAYVSVPAGDFRLQATSACLGFGPPAGVSPGIARSPATASVTIVRAPTVLPPSSIAALLR